MGFFGFVLGAAFAGANTTRLLCEKLTEAGALERLCAAFNRELTESS
jgi:hypothetical protein